MKRTICSIVVLLLAVTAIQGCGRNAEPMPISAVTTTTEATTKRIPTYRLTECEPTNLNYDLSAYKLYYGDVGKHLQTVTDDAMLKEFAGRISDKILKTDDISCELSFQDHSFAIVKIGDFWEWQRRTGVEELGYYPDNSEYVCYTVTYGKHETAGPCVTFDIYKDPSSHFIVVTQCRDYKIVYELFERASGEKTNESETTGTDKGDGT